jgi:hypothetical protein
LAQLAQQKMRPPASTPWPMTRQPQWEQVGATAWIAHSKLSKVWVGVRHDDLERLVVVVAADLTLRHTSILPAQGERSNSPL